MYASKKTRTPEVIMILLKAGADEKLKGTDAYWKLHEAQY